MKAGDQVLSLYDNGPAGHAKYGDIVFLVDYDDDDGSWNCVTQEGLEWWVHDKDEDKYWKYLGETEPFYK